MYFGLSESTSLGSRAGGSGGLGTTSRRKSSSGIGDGGPRSGLAIFLQEQGARANFHHAYMFYRKQITGNYCS